MAKLSPLGPLLVLSMCYSKSAHAGPAAQWSKTESCLTRLNVAVSASLGSAVWGQLVPAWCLPGQSALQWLSGVSVEMVEVFFLNNLFLWAI